MNHVEEQYDKTVFGFWVYLVTDFVLFAAYFATYAVLAHRTFGGPRAVELVSMPLVVWRTVILLVGSMFAGFAGIQAHKKNRGGVILWMLLTLACGVVFFCMQFTELKDMYVPGFGWERSASLSAFFNLVGVLLVHIIFAAIWTVLFLIPVIRCGVDDTSVRRLTCLKMFWQFINVIWVFIFTIVYVIGVA